MHMWQVTTILKIVDNGRQLVGIPLNELGKTISGHSHVNELGSFSNLKGMGLSLSRPKGISVKTPLVLSLLQKE